MSVHDAGGILATSHNAIDAPMTPAGLIDQIAEQVSRLLPQGLTQEMRRNLHAALRSTFDRLELVTRDELEVQEQVLLRTRARLEEMERRVAELEARAGKK